jgi:hypothetical protein
LILVDPKEEALEEKLFSLFSSEKLQNYNEIFTQKQV